MGLPRSLTIPEDAEGVYHCFSRCVRRARLFGRDPFSNKDFSHRRQWIEDRLRFLSRIFVIDVCAFAILVTHYHSILRKRPDLLAALSDREIASRWLTLCPKHRKGINSGLPTDAEIDALAAQPERIAELRRRLGSISWFMAKINEPIARAANREDGVTGRFWEGRFKCQQLLDEASIASCMVYVDLNPIRSGIASMPENSDFTSIRERIRAWKQEQSKVPDGSLDWLCPLEDTGDRRGILGISPEEYFILVDGAGRIKRADKRGAMDETLDPILTRLGVNPARWEQTSSTFGSMFQTAAGRTQAMRSRAERLGRKWLKGIRAAAEAFLSEKV